MTVTLAGDRHGLPVTMAAVALREDNWHVHHLGADLPGDELMRFGEQRPVDLAALTVTSTEVHPAATSAAALVRALGVRALVGGSGDRLEELQDLARGADGGAMGGTPTALQAIHTARDGRDDG